MDERTFIQLEHKIMGDTRNYYFKIHDHKWRSLIQMFDNWLPMISGNWKQLLILYTLYYDFLFIIIMEITFVSFKCNAFQKNHTIRTCKTFKSIIKIGKLVHKVYDKVIPFEDWRLWTTLNIIIRIDLFKEFNFISNEWFSLCS